MKRYLSAATIVALAALFGSAAGCGKTEPPAPAKITTETPKGKTDETKSPPAETKTADNTLPKIEPAPVFPPPPVEETKKAPTEIKLPPLVEKTPERAKPTTTVAVTAETLSNELDKDAIAAGKKYGPALVEITGVARVAGSRGTETFVTLDSGPGLGIMCVLEKEPEPWAKISRGQKIKLRGLWPATSLGQHGLVACEIVELGPSLATEVTAETLAEEFAKDRTGVSAKYNEKTLIVRGVMVGAIPNELGAVRVLLKGVGDSKVDCGFNAENRGEANPLKVGQSVRFVGEFSALESQDGPALRGCRVLKSSN